MSSRPTPTKHRSLSAQTNIGAVVVMRLYVADGGPNSARAVVNLAAICNEHLADRFELEVIDVLGHPQTALANGILVTPTLVKLSPGPTTTTVGDLSDTSGVLLALGIT